MATTGRQRRALESVSTHVPRLDADEKVTGAVEYVDDLPFDDVYHVRVHRSTEPHARVVDVDTRAAEAVDGVERVVTRADLRELAETTGFDPYFGPAIRDQPVLAMEKVHYVGDPVAAVVARDRQTATEAADLVEVTYEPLGYVSTIDEALADDAPVVHETFEPAETFSDLEQVVGGRDTNVAYTFRLRHGDAEAALAGAERVFEHTYHTPPVQHMAFEPFVAVARAGTDGRLRVWTPNQSPHFLRNELAGMFGLPESKVEVRVPQVGGAYGAKLYGKVEPLAAVCAVLTGKTIKLRQDVEESFDTIVRHATRVTIRTGVDADGAPVAQHVDVAYDTGAYAEIGPRMAKKSGYTASGPYEIPHVSIDSHCVYTNKPPAGAFRGFGVPQLVSAYEAQMDDIAAALGRDPVAYRREHAVGEGSTHPTGAAYESVGLRECLDAVVDSMGWDEPLDQPAAPHLRRGRGVAISYKACLTPTSSGAIVVMSGDGSLTVHSSSVEMGQGVRTTLAQVVAEELGVDVDRVTVADPDTAISPFDTNTASSRSTFHMGNAVIEAVGDLRRQLVDLAADAWGVAPADVVVEDGAVVAPGSGERWTLGEAVRAAFGSAGGTFVGRGYYTTEGGHHDPETGKSERPTVFWFFGATGAVVDVDVETGAVTVREVHTAADVGQAIDPVRVDAQLTGAMAHALGQTLHEEMTFEAGQQTNRQLLDYKLPSLQDMPAVVENHVVEVAHPDGPYGAIGVGETGAFGVTPAVGNAIADATGVRLDRIPFTPERVLRALDGRADR